MPRLARIHTSLINDLYSRMAWRVNVRKRLESFISFKDESTDEDDIFEVVPTDSDGEPSEMSSLPSRTPVILKTAHLVGPEMSQSSRIIASMRRTGEKETVDRILMPPPNTPSKKRKRHVPPGDLFGGGFASNTWSDMGVSELAYDEINLTISEMYASSKSLTTSLPPPLATGFSSGVDAMDISCEEMGGYYFGVPYRNRGRSVLFADETLDDSSDHLDVIDAPPSPSKRRRSALERTQSFTVHS